MKKNDYVLIAVILLAAGIIFGGYQFLHRQDGAVVTVSVDGKITGTYSLNEDKEIRINDTNTLVIKDGEADMTKADCPDQICVKQKSISKNGETIVCLPNKVVITVISDSSSELDVIAE